MLPSLQNIKKILIFTGGGIGDVVMSLPTLRSIGECFKGKEIDIAISSRVRDIVDNVIKWNDVIVWDKGLVKKTITRSLISNYDLLLHLRKRRYDLLIDIEAVETTRAAVKRFIFYKLINVKEIAGRNTDGRGFYLDYKTEEELLGNEHEVNRRLSVAESLGCEIVSRDITLGLDRSYVKAADNILRTKGVEEGDFIVGINPNAFKPTRLWGVDRFIMLARRIKEFYGAKIAVIGGEGDRSVSERILNEIGRDGCFELVGLNLITLAAVISRFNVFVTNDTGPMHIAAAVKTPVVAIFGPENPYRYAPYIAEGLRRVVYINNISCRPCTKYDCDKMECMNPVTIDMVWDNFRSLADDILRKRNGSKK